MKKLRAYLVKILVVVGVVFSLLSLIEMLFSLSETWHHISAFVSDHTSFLSDQQVSYLRTGLLVLGACFAGFEMGRTRKDREPSKLLIGSAVVCLGVGVALFGVAALDQFESPRGPKVGISNNHALGGAESHVKKKGSPHRGSSSEETLAKEEGEEGSSGSFGGGAASESKGSGCTCPYLPAPLPEEEPEPEPLPEEPLPEEPEEPEPEEPEPEEFESFEAEEVVFE